MHSPRKNMVLYRGNVFPFILHILRYELTHHGRNQYEQFEANTCILVTSIKLIALF